MLIKKVELVFMFVWFVICSGSCIRLIIENNDDDDGFISTEFYL